MDSGRHCAPTSLRAFAHVWTSLSHVVIFRVFVVPEHLPKRIVRAYFSLVYPGSGQAPLLIGEA